ncbi:ubiquitin carboxyl-terminal hydrolase [Endozoicomonas ascidiicola]|uniref:ubiquitin carboxyl-terminal hydrolase n=1 Tax=Endozoicomonas ascidiicola TaxID=1698521 RepID=UPI001C12C625|nr:ubiquitin carboxyl-terminal hydrolase family protein [Endozoicomonas ascidiicola]
MDTKTFNTLPILLKSYAAGIGGTEGQSRKLVPETEALKAQLDRPLTISVIDKELGQEKKITLRLKSVCLHIGGESDGRHYTAAVKHAKIDEKDQWWLHDDSSVSTIGQLSTVRGQPYLLFYEKVSE